MPCDLVTAGQSGAYFVFFLIGDPPSPIQVALCEIVGRSKMPMFSYPASLEANLIEYMGWQRDHLVELGVDGMARWLAMYQGVNFCTIGSKATRLIGSTGWPSVARNELVVW